MHGSELESLMGTGGTAVEFSEGWPSLVVQWVSVQRTWVQSLV